MLGVTFKAPLSDGSTTVTVTEDVAVASVVYNMVVTPLVDVVMVTNSSHFNISGTEVRTTSNLDFETATFHILNFK